MESAMLRLPEGSARADLARLRAAIAGSPIRLAAPPPMLAWDKAHQAPGVDGFILNWIVGHVPPRRPRDMH